MRQTIGLMGYNNNNNNNKQTISNAL